MRYQPLSRRLINLIYPLVIYMAIGMAVLGIYPNGGLMANLIEKVSCIIIMGILFYKDSKQIRLGSAFDFCRSSWQSASGTVRIYFRSTSCLDI